MRGSSGSSSRRRRRYVAGHLLTAERLAGIRYGRVVGIPDLLRYTGRVLLVALAVVCCGLPVLVLVLRRRQRQRRLEYWHARSGGGAAAVIPSEHVPLEWSAVHRRCDVTPQVRAVGIARPQNRLIGSNGDWAGVGLVEQRRSVVRSRPGAPSLHPGAYRVLRARCNDAAAAAVVVIILPLLIRPLHPYWRA